jgi:hypothetical protein
MNRVRLGRDTVLTGLAAFAPDYVAIARRQSAFNSPR